ncbi:MAG: mandelate racemase/muconate lactonizing enzyme family protein [Pirellulales bacterium]|nr:mandelate racemase/muconate lactonizing enzyme family protein [Pirellulales bacterium]
MKIVGLETFLCNGGLRNYLFVRLRTSSGLTGVGEATLEWQERTVQTLLHEWVEPRLLGEDPACIERLVGGMVRDQYQGGATVMTAISAVEVALWDLLGKSCGRPVYQLLGGRVHQHLPAYANGWYGGAQTPEDYAERARDVAARGYRGLKFDPFGTAWKELTRQEAERAVAITAAIREAVGPEVQLFIEFHGRLSLPAAAEMLKLLEPLAPAWCEEPLAPERLDLLAALRARTDLRLAAGERLYTLAEFFQLAALRACDVVQPDLCHCGGLLPGKKIAAMAEARDMLVAPHCSIGPVALAAALHFDACTPNFMIQEAFGEWDVPWRDELVCGWNPLRHGVFELSDTPGLGLELNEAAIAAHPYQPQSFPSLWDEAWLARFSSRRTPREASESEAREDEETPR